MIHFQHIRSTGNIGDLASCPAQYFEFPEHSIGNYAEPVPECDAVIFGGGTLTQWAAGRAPEVKTRILWGTGSTRHGETEPWPDPDGFDLIGTREWTAEREAAGLYVPCASCMSPLFDEHYEIKHEAVRFVNADPSIKSRYPMGADELPTMENTGSFEDTIAFLGSAPVVVTNSYHGCSFAQLLGRRVVCVPYSSKFHGFKYPVAYSENRGNDWREKAKKTAVYSEVLSDSRAQNIVFYRKVLELIG